MEKEYIIFEFQRNSDSGKTKIYKVISKTDGFCLGMIRWYGAWRKYVYRPSDETIFDSSCLESIKVFLDNLMKERSAAKHE